MPLRPFGARWLRDSWIVRLEDWADRLVRHQQIKVIKDKRMAMQPAAFNLEKSVVPPRPGSANWSNKGAMTKVRSRRHPIIGAGFRKPTKARPLKS